MKKTTKKETVVIFGGAGASKAVSPSDYPTTVEFFEQLPSEITDNKLFQQTLGFAKKNLGHNAVIDIEVILWHLEELRTFLHKAQDQRSVPGWFVQGSRLSDAIGLKNQNFGHLKSIVDNAIPRIKGLVSSINQQVYALYSRKPQIDELHDNWLSLLRPILNAELRVELVTTNYDVVLETVIEELGKRSDSNIDTGRSGGVYPILNTSLWDHPSSQPDTKGLLTKLHGSVDWQRGQGVIHTGTPTFAGTHERHVIIYPGFKGRPKEPEFEAFHEHFRRTLEVATGVLFIGFAFRDDYINELCEQRFRLNTSPRVILLNPDDNVHVPGVDDRLIRIPELFDRDTSMKAAHHLIFGD